VQQQAAGGARCTPHADGYYAAGFIKLLFSGDSSKLLWAPSVTRGGLCADSQLLIQRLIHYLSSQVFHPVPALLKFHWQASKERGEGISEPAVWQIIGKSDEAKFIQNLLAPYSSSFCWSSCNFF
jgi:hypothetical protein